MKRELEIHFSLLPPEFINRAKSTNIFSLTNKTNNTTVQNLLDRFDEGYTLEETFLLTELLEARSAICVFNAMVPDDEKKINFNNFATCQNLIHASKTLTSLSQYQEELKSLTELDLSNYCLTHLPDFFGLVVCP